jgi:hypothetical protein
MQGDQSELVPRDRYRLGLAGLEAYSQKQFQQSFQQRSRRTQQDKVLHRPGKRRDRPRRHRRQAVLLSRVLGNTMEGFFADPVYGGNRDMVSWKMIGFPGARYDYRDYIGPAQPEAQPGAALHHRQLRLDQEGLIRHGQKTTFHGCRGCRPRLGRIHHRQRTG